MSMGIDDCDDGINELTVTIDASCSASFVLSESSSNAGNGVVYNAVIIKATNCDELSLRINELNIKMQYLDWKKKWLMMNI